MERVISVQKLTCNRTLSCNKQFVYGSSYIQEIDNGALVLHPTTMAYQYIPHCVLDAVKQYLVKLFGLRNTPLLEDMLQKTLNDTTVPTTQRLYSTLFTVCEDIVHCWERGLTTLRVEPWKIPTSIGARRRLYQDIMRPIRAFAEHFTQVVHYSGTHGNQMVLAYALTNALGWNKDTAITVVERNDGTFLIREAKTTETKYINCQTPIHRPGTIHGFRYLYLTKTQKHALHIGTELYRDGVDLKFTFDFAQNHRMIIEPLSPEEQKTLPTMPRFGGVDWSGWFASKRIVQRHVSGPIILPQYFVDTYGIERSDSVRTELRGHKLYIYGKTHACDFCGHVSEPNQLHNVPLCADCADVLDETRTIINRSADMDDAVRAAKSELLHALKRIENLEGSRR